jgi:Calcineurin-like phosphoesterase
MNRVKLLLVIVFVLFTVFARAQAQDSIQNTIILIGDAGELTKDGRQPVVDAARKRVKMNEKTTVIYLGDNLYKTGLPDNSIPNYAIAKAPLDSQIHIAGKAKTNVYFIPGNHDWANGAPVGYESILRVQSYIDYLGNNYVAMLPRDGCPGPVEVKISNDVTLVIMDSQWWLHINDKPTVESDCPFKTKEEVLTELDEILSKNSGKLVLFATHHPFRTYGPHGGYFNLKQHIFPFTDAIPNLYFPLPVIGSAYPLTRAVFGTAQDLKHPLYQEMIRAIEPIVKSHPNVIYIAGHEHTLQLIKDSGYHYIVSGSGSKSNRVSKTKKTLFASSQTGFATLQISKNKNVRATFYGVTPDTSEVLYSENILDFSALPVEKKDTMREVEYVFKDSVVISATDRYKEERKFSQLFMGNNYRKVWSTPVSLKMFNIRKEQGGFKILSLGGGKQTKSLKLEDSKGKEWTLRMIEKDPEKALPQNLRGTLAQDVVEDMISASDPYAPLVVPVLSKALGIPTADPKYFFVPDDPALGKYRPLFANRVVTLEDRNPVPDNDTKSTSKILNKLYEENDHKVNQYEVLTARLLDMYIGDFDRHADQWKWGTDDTGKGKLYYPVPRDRDQAFFNSDGLLVKVLSNSKMRFLQGFKSNIKDIKGANFVARDFDRSFLNTIDEPKWKSITDSFTLTMTDKLIDEAVSKYPRELNPSVAQNTAAKLKSRRNHFAQQSMKYYRFISRYVTVTGSNQEEYFHVMPGDNGFLKLNMYKKKPDTDTALLLYSRSFDPKVTRELRLFGFNGNDKFEIDPRVSSRIKLRIIGGKGEDSFDLKGKINNHLYDLSTEKNVLLNTNKTRNEMSGNVDVLNFRNTGFQYNQFSFPMLNLGFNAEDGVLLGVGMHSRTFGFRTVPYATDQKLTTLVSPNNSAFKFKYQGEFNQAIGKNDLLINGDFVNPTLNNFFGLGNSTVYDKNNSISYYRVRYKYASADLLLRKRFNDILQLSVGPTYYRYWNSYEDNAKRILGKPSLQGLDSASIFRKKDYLGFKANLDINYVNSEIFPSRGITWFTTFTSLYGASKNSDGLSKLQSDMTVYAKVSDLSRISTVLRVGAGRIFSSKYEYFQALTLGANNYLRGFRKDRFSGSAMAYSSVEMRYRLFTSKSHVLPGDVGLMGFFDIGRVWQKGESSKQWHNATGGGIYFVPFNMIMLSATIAVSEEDKLFNFTLGTKFNLNF